MGSELYNLHAQRLEVLPVERGYLHAMDPCCCGDERIRKLGPVVRPLAFGHKLPAVVRNLGIDREYMTRQPGKDKLFQPSFKTCAPDPRVGDLDTVSKLKYSDCGEPKL